MLGIGRRTVSGADGDYRILGLPAGTYVVTNSKAGFATETIHDLELTVNSAITLNTVLKVGSQVETMEVSGATPLLESVTSSTEITIRTGTDRPNAASTDAITWTYFNWCREWQSTGSRIRL